jgi:hypothetical protein
VLSLLADGSAILAAADAAGVHRNTIHNWRRTSPPFQTACEALARERSLQWRDEIHSLAPAAIDTLRKTLTGPATAPGLRLRAALAVLKHVTAPLPEPPAGDPTPEPVDSPEPPAETNPPAEPVQKNFVHNSAQPAAPVPYHRPTPKTGRNEPCPCGSGLKFKRCCLDQRPSTKPTTPVDSAS